MNNCGRNSDEIHRSFHILSIISYLITCQPVPFPCHSLKNLRYQSEVFVRLFFSSVKNKAVKLFNKGVYILELSVNGRETNICNIVYFL